MPIFDDMTEAELVAAYERKKRELCEGKVKFRRINERTLQDRVHAAKIASVVHMHDICGFGGD
jgi:hypothetical protein